MGVGTQIKKFRKQAKLTQSVLAEKMGVHETTIRRWEQEKDGGPDSKAINTLAEVLNITPEQLLSSSDNKKEVDTEIKNGDTFYYESNGQKIEIPARLEFMDLFLRAAKELRFGTSPVAAV